MSFSKDYKSGKRNEEEVLHTINIYFKDNIKQTQSQYSSYDFEGDKHIYELKARRCNHNTYATTMIGKDKLIKSEKRQIFLFKFYDGLYYIKHRRKKFKQFEVKMFRRNDRVDKTDVEKEYLYIPIEKLKKIIL
jgi:hypothetical protein